MISCSDCIKSRKRACGVALVRAVFLPGRPVCPKCGSATTDKQGQISGCTNYSYYTMFECGSRYLVSYRWDDTDHCQESSVISSVIISDVCMVTSVEDDVV